MKRFYLRNVNPGAIDAERERVLALLHSTVPVDRVHEVGSTAVPGVIGKQDLDFLVLIPAEEFEVTRSELDKRFPRDPNQMSNGCYQGYRVDSTLDVAIQLTVRGGSYDTFLYFLDRLKGSESLRAEYNRLKRSFDGRPMDEYRDAKRVFIERVLSAANTGGSIDGAGSG